MNDGEAIRVLQHNCYCPYSELPRPVKATLFRIDRRHIRVKVSEDCWEFPVIPVGFLAHLVYKLTEDARFTYADSVLLVAVHLGIDLVTRNKGTEVGLMALWENRWTYSEERGYQVHMRGSPDEDWFTMNVTQVEFLLYLQADILNFRFNGLEIKEVVHRE